MVFPKNHPLLHPSYLFPSFSQFLRNQKLSPTNLPPQLSNLTHSITISTTTASSPTDQLIASLRKGENWNSLTKKFSSINLTNTTIDKILLQLKETPHAKQALSFFHWSAHHSNTKHNLRSYCIIIHILVRARILTDARALLESVMRRTNTTTTKNSVVELLVTTYNNTSSTPLVFDMLVQTYAKLRMFDTAFDACCYIEQHGFSCSIISFNTLIQVIQKSSGSISLVWKVYEHMICMRKYPNEVTVRIMINALCKEGKLQKVVDILDRIHGKRCSPSVIVNTWVVYGVLQEGRVDDGILLLKRMLQKNIILDDVGYSLIIFGKCKGNNGLDSARVVFGEMVERGFSANAFLYTLFIGGHCKEGRIDEATKLMEEMQAMGLKAYDETFNVLIEGCADYGRLDESFKFCEEMVNRGFLPSCSAFNKMVRDLGELGEVKRGNEMLTVLLEKGFQPNEVTYSYLMDGYGNQAEIQEVLKLYYEMEYKKHSPGLMVYTSLIRSLCHCGKFNEAERYLIVMEDHSLTPSGDIYESLVAGYYNNGNARKALQIYEKMVIMELKPSGPDFMDLVKRLSSDGLKNGNGVLEK